MNKIGVFYGSTVGKTKSFVEVLITHLEKENYEVRDVKNGIKGIENFNNLILISPSYGMGELQEDWKSLTSELEKIDFTDKNVAIVGLGNALRHPTTYLGAMKVIYDIVFKKGAHIIGSSPIEGHIFEHSPSIINNKFLGLALDEVNQHEETPIRMERWLKEIKKEFK